MFMNTKKTKSNFHRPTWAYGGSPPAPKQHTPTPVDGVFDGRPLQHRESRFWASNPKFPFVHEQTTPAASRTGSKVLNLKKRGGRLGFGYTSEGRGPLVRMCSVLRATMATGRCVPDGDDELAHFATSVRVSEVCAVACAAARRKGRKLVRRRRRHASRARRLGNGRPHLPYPLSISTSW